MALTPDTRPAIAALSPLESLDAAFLALSGAASSGTLPVDSFIEEGGAVMLPIVEVRGRLAHPATPPEVRTRIWRAVVVRAHRCGEPWTTAAAGLAVPVLRRMLSRLVRASVADREELEQEMLTALLAELAVVDPADPLLDRRLLRAADRAGHRVAYAAMRAARCVELRPELPVRGPGDGDGDDVGDGSRNEYTLLVAAVRAGVLTTYEAQLIACTRLAGASMSALAHSEAGAAGAESRRRWLYRCRTDAERRLVAFLFDEGDAPDRT
ncbi:hypothetical protein [Streptomyces boninensis]|uniref:hypothetical protein n=1 Tax=Streptomyces boninensis TaxID=2039455 RepID=UPI003B21F06C